MTTTELTINHSVQTEVVGTIANMLREKYIFEDVAEKMADYIEENSKNGSYEDLTDAEAFCNQLTKDMQEISNDKHVSVSFTVEKKETKDEKSMEQMLDEYEKQAKVANYGFYNVDRLSGNIGYIDLRQFYPVNMAGDAVVNAMNLVANTDSLIIDLRKMAGGDPNTVALMTSYLVDEQPVHLNSFHKRENNTYIQFWTNSYVHGKRYGNKPVYVLTSDRTASAGEEFCYNLKNIKRATLIGEKTVGAANPGKFHQVTENFRVFIPTGRAENPITKTNWEGVGVEPNFKMSKEEAFDFAYDKALKDVINKYKGQEIYNFLVKEAEESLTRNDNK